jgi:hypothetical protein
MTIERPMFPPRDSSRRGFLAISAGAAVVAIIPSATALATQAPIMSPAFRNAAEDLAHAFAALAEAREIYDAHEEMYEDWEAANPMPTSRRGKKKWLKRANAFREPMIPIRWQALMQAETDFAAAQDALAAIPPADAGDIRTKMACAALYDAVEIARINRAPIARAVVADLIAQADGKAVRS